MKNNQHKQSLRKAIGLACLAALSAASSVHAADWLGGSMSYTNAANWNTGIVPSASATGNARNNAGIGTVIQVNPGDPDWALGNQDILLGDGGTSAGSYLQNGPNVSLNFWFRMGLNGASTVGYAQVDSGTLAIGGQLNISEGGTATFVTTNSGVVTVGGELWVGNNGGANGTLDIGGTSSLSCNSWFVVGRNTGTGLMNVGGSAVVNKTGGGVLIVGDNATGVLNQNGTAAISTTEMWVGQAGAGNGTYNMSENASLTGNNWFVIGRDGGTGVLNMTNNASLTKNGANPFLVGASGPGSINQDGGTVTVTTETWMGENGAAVWNMNALAGNNVLSLVQFGRNAAGSGVLNLSGGSFAANQITQGAGIGFVNFNGGTLRARMSTASFMSGVSGVLQAGGAVIDSQGFDVTISSILSDGGNGNLTKLGSGKLILAGANTYIGTSTVSAGKLVMGNTSLVTTDVNVANGAGFGGAVVVAGSQAIHTNVTLTGPVASLDFELGGFGNPTVAPLNVTNLTVNGTITVNVSASVLAVGTVPLMDFTSISGAHTFVMGTLPAGVVATVNETANQLQLVITSAGAPRWDGAALGTWNIGANLDWFDLGTLAPTTYANGQPVLFDDAAVGTTTVTLNAGTYTPSSIIVTNDTLAYTFTGAGSIGGAIALNKTGTNSLTIANINSYSGPTLVTGGTLSINSIANGGVNSTIGSSSANATNLVLTGATLSYTGPATVTDRGYTLNPGNNLLNIANDLQFDGVIAANAGGNFAKAGNGTLSVKRTGANALSAGGGGNAYTIRDGTVVLDGSAGAQVNTVNGEMWPGGTTNGTGGHLVLTNTTLNISSWLAVARATGTGGYTSSASLYNSALTSGGGSIGYSDGIVGSLQTGSLTLNGTSTYTNNADGNWGESEGTTAFVSLKDSSIMHNQNRMHLGDDNPGSATGGTGVLVVANSAKIVVNAWLSIGNQGGTGSVLLKDNGTLVTTSDLNLCDVNNGSSDLLAQDNSVINSAILFIGKGIGSAGTMTITNSSTVTIANGSYLGASIGGSVNPAAGSGDGTLNLSGGSLSTTLIKGQANGVDNLSVSTVNFNGGKLIATGNGNDFVYNLTAANVLAGGAVIEINTNHVRSIPQALTDGGGGGGLTKLGTGTLLLNGVNTYTGSTVATGTLGGSGSVVGNVTAEHLSPGDTSGVGQFTIGGNLSFSGDLTVHVATSVAPSNDVVAVTGTATYTGAGTIYVTNVGPGLQVGQKFQLFNAPVAGAGAMTVVGGDFGSTWTNKLAVDGTIEVLSVLPAPVFSPGSVATLPDGNKSVTGTGTIGQPYRLWASPDVSAPLNTWTLLNTGTITVSPFTINDLNATNFPSRFYIFSTP